MLLYRFKKKAVSERTGGLGRMRGSVALTVAIEAKGNDCEGRLNEAKGGVDVDHFCFVGCICVAFV